MDTEIEFRGFDGVDAQEYVTKTVGSIENANTMLMQAVDKGLCRWDGEDTFFLELSFLRIPIFLHMALHLVPLSIESSEYSHWNVKGNSGEIHKQRGHQGRCTENK